MPGEFSEAPLVNATPDVSEAIFPEWNKYAFAQPRLKNIIDDWKPLSDEQERVRKLRHIRVDKESLKADGLLVEDETYVAVRLIDQNIRAEQPQRVAYITQSRRTSVFIGPKEVTPDKIDLLESDFTKVSRYLGWETPFLRTDDGSITHGWDSVEVAFDIDYPGHFCVEHVGHDKLMFDREAEQSENQEVLIRKVNLTALQLRVNVTRFGFSSLQVKDLIDKNKKNEQATKDVQYEVYKCFYRQESDGVIYVGWFEPTLSDWIKAPEPLFMGIRDITKLKTEVQGDGTMDYPKVYETEYPFYILRYTESENDKIAETKGRGFLDEPSQNAASCVLSGIVNGTARAYKVYGSSKQNPAQPNTNPPKQLNIVLKPGLLYDNEIQWAHTEYPPVSAIQALNALTSYNKTETAKVDFAVNNRQDSRKTATEVAKADKDSGELSSVQVINLSIFIRQVYTRCWRIYKARVLQGNIVVDEDIQPLFNFDYVLFSSGDVDVIKREEKMQRQMQAWPVIQKTPLANLFLQDYIRNAFPEEADRYVKALSATDPRQIVVALSTCLQAAVVDPQTGKLRPELNDLAPQLMQLQQMTEQYLASTASAEQGAAPGKQMEEDTKLENPAELHNMNRNGQSQTTLTA